MLFLLAGGDRVTISPSWAALVGMAVAALGALRSRARRRRRGGAGSELGDPARDWRYAAEGALNVACRYVGRDERLRGKVLRLAKANPEALGAAGNDADRWSQGRHFIRDVMSPLLGEEFIPHSRSVRLSREFVETLARTIENERPEARRKHPLDGAAPFGLLMTDHARLDCACREHEHRSYCFEIKPKWGFRFPRSSHEVKRRVDRFTMHQHLKRAEEDVGEISLYSPLELFQGDVDSISMALVRLATTPQNNFRFFLDGRQAFPLSNSVSTFWEAEKSGNELLHAAAKALAASGVLSRVRRAQMMSEREEDAYDIEYVWPVYEEMTRRGEHVPQLHVGGAPDLTAPPPSTTTLEGRAETVRRFLIACTARDCSLMIALSQCPSLVARARGDQEDVAALCLTPDGKWCFRVAVVDLDAKPVEKLRYYYEVDREIVAHYSKSVGRR